MTAERYRGAARIRVVVAAAAVLVLWQVRVDSRSGASVRLTIHVGAAPPNLIEGLLCEPLAPGPTCSLYVPLRDGVGLAVDVRLPDGGGLGLGGRRVRGTGASFGTWVGSPSATETVGAPSCRRRPGGAR
jgi:hypothetical protein